MTKIKPRFQEIKYNSNGVPFVRYKNRIHYLNEFMRCEKYSVYDYNRKEPLINVNGYKTTSNYGGLLIEINDSGEAAKIVYQSNY